MGTKRGKVNSAARLYFRRYVARISMSPDADKQFLPLAHGTPAVFLRDILAEGSIKMPEQPCETLKERLVFSFYGRPSYIRSKSNAALTRPSGAPTYILLKESVLTHAKLAHPLDTGAFKEDLYRGYIDGAFRPTDFGFEPTREDILKVVFNFFGSNASYMDFRPRQPNIEPGEHEAQAYLDVINSRDEARVDVRDSSIEVALCKEIEINHENVQCMIIPDILLDSELYGKLIRKNRIDVRAYKYTPPIDGDGHAGRILDCVLTYYREMGLL